MEGFRSLKEGEAVEFTFKKSAKGLESIRVTGPGGVFCIGSERRPKGKNTQKRRSKGDRYGPEGSLCKLPRMVSTQVPPHQVPKDNFNFDNSVMVGLQLTLPPVAKSD